MDDLGLLLVALTALFILIDKTKKRIDITNKRIEYYLICEYLY